MRTIGSELISRRLGSTHTSRGARRPEDRLPQHIGPGGRAARPRSRLTARGTNRDAQAYIDPTRVRASVLGRGARSRTHGRCGVDLNIRAVARPESIASIWLLSRGLLRQDTAHFHVGPADEARAGSATR